jgi:uncharacterized repeat protein (TIGR01451 family)
MIDLRRWLHTATLLALAAGAASAQIGVASGPANRPLACTAESDTRFVRPEGYTELLGDIVITCTGGPLLTAGSAVPTADITIYVLPEVPLTSRIFDRATGLSEGLLSIDEPGAELATGVNGLYGPKAPESLCAVKAGCPAFAQLDRSSVYPVASSTATAGSNASNVYQGYVGVLSANSITFYNVPVLPPVLQGVSRVFRIANLRISAVGLPNPQSIATVVSVNPSSVLPISAANAPVTGYLRPPMAANVEPAPAGGQGPFSPCVPPQGPALTAKLQFTENVQAGSPAFKTRVAPLTDTAWASTLPNTATPGQNIPWWSSESGLILPAATATVGGVSYTAGLTDFGTRLKAVFTNIPAGITLYVSTTNVAAYRVPGGTSTAPYAVLVAASQTGEANGDGGMIAELRGSAVAGSDGLAAYPLTPDASGTAAAVWETVNAGDSFAFSVYIDYAGVPATTGQLGAAVSNVALSFAPEPGGGAFTLPGGAGPLTSPIPRYAAASPRQASWVSIGTCGDGIRSATPAPFAYTIGGAEPSQTLGVTTAPGGLTVSATPNEAWLLAAVGGNTLSIRVNPAGLSASTTPYIGSVRLTAPGLSDLLLPVSLTVSAAPVLRVTAAHAGNFAQGLSGASYTITVSNAAGAGATSGQVVATDRTPAGLTVVSMSGVGWACMYLPNCTRSDPLAGGSSYPPIAVSVNVAGDAVSPQMNVVGVNGGGSAAASATDPTLIFPAPALSIALTHAGRFARGQTNAVYRATVSNGAAAGPASGAVTVTETVPAGLTLVSMAGSGWTCSGNTCLRSDPLPGGASYPSIAVSVNVAGNAPLHVTNRASVAAIGSAPASAVDVTPLDTPPSLFLISTYAGGLPVPTAAIATSYPLAVAAVATDQFGNTYVAAGNVYKIDPDGILTLVAGNGKPGFSGDGGLAVNAQLNSPQGLAVDSTGNLYISDHGNNSIRMVAPSGVITTVAGTGVAGYSGDNGPATKAQLYDPEGVAVDAAGNLYIADSSNERIREVTPGGIISTAAGNGNSGFWGDTGPATGAQLSDPRGVAVDSTGNLYIADFWNNRVRAVAPNGTITTFAGNGVQDHLGDGGPATSAALAQPIGVAVSSTGTLYVTDNGRYVRAVSASGMIATAAGTDTGGFSGDGGSATSAELLWLQGVAVDSAGNLYIADTGNGRVREVTPGGIIGTIAGGSISPFYGDGGPAVLGGFSGIQSIAADASGNLYIQELDSYTIRKISAAGGVSTIAGTGACCDSGDGGQATAAQVNPQVVAVDSAGNVYLDGYARVRKIDTNGAITTVAGNGSWGSTGDGGSATSAQVAQINGLAADSAGDLYISDSVNQRIRMVTPGGIISTVAGTGTAGYSGDGGPGTSAQLNQPTGLAVDTAENLYILDSNNQRIRRLTPDGTITTVAGNGGSDNTGDGGPATFAQLGGPLGLTIDPAGNLYFATGSLTIRRVSAGGTITTIAGDGLSPAYIGDAGPALAAQFMNFSGLGLAADGSGNLYVPDNGGSALRMLQPEGASPLLTVSTTHAGNFNLGQSGAGYSVTVSNAALAGPTSGTVTVTDFIPAGLTVGSMTGTGWSCSSNACTRTNTDTLEAGASYPPIMVRVDVAGNALPQVTNIVTVSGGGSPGAGAEDPTFIGASTPVLEISATHNGNFSQMQQSATYTLIAGNQMAAAATTTSTVTVTDTLPAGLNLVSMAGTGWTCPANACTRNDSLPGGGVYPAITVTVNVAQDAPSQVTNQVTVSGGGSANASASDVTFISVANCGISGGGSATVADVQHIVNEALGAMPAVHDLNQDGRVNVADVQKLVNDALGLGCAN